MQLALDGPLITQGRIEAPSTNTCIYAMTGEEATVETSNVVTCQIYSLSENAYVLFDTGITLSFVSISFAKKIGRNHKYLIQDFTTMLPSGEVMTCTH